MVTTTVGNVLINEQLPEDLRDYSRIVNKKELAGILNSIGTKHPKRYAEIVKNLKDLGDTASYESGSSFSLKDLLPENMSGIYKKYEPEYKALEKISNPDEKISKRKEINRKVDEDISERIKSDLKTKPNSFDKWIVSGARGGNDDLRQLRYSVGNMVDVKNQIYPFRANRSLSQGLTPTDFFITSLGARKGIVGSFISVRDPGAFSKELCNITNDMIITENDCGTKHGKDCITTDPGIIDRYLCNPAGEYHRNELITTRVQENLVKHGIKNVIVRSPLYCEAKEGVCAYCVGVLENGTHPPIGDTVGVRSSQAISEPLTQMALGSKHSGGVVQKRTAFDEIKQLMHMPENFPEGAVLARISGKVDKIHKAFDGGHEIHIGNEMHYLTPRQGVTVKEGDTVEHGDAISTGLINPAEVTKYKGMYKGREYLSEALRDVYDRNGANGHPKVFETIVRSVMNLGKVTDPGDHDHSVGDIVRWNQAQPLTKPLVYQARPLDSVGYRLVGDLHGVPKGTLITSAMADEFHRKSPVPIQVYKNPMKIDPYIIGTERAALHKDDWLSNLGFRFLKPTLLENAAVGRVTSIHSVNPIPAYVIGAEMGGIGEKGEF